MAEKSFLKLEGSKIAKSFMSNYFSKSPIEEESYATESVEVVPPSKKRTSLFSSPRAVIYTSADVTSPPPESESARQKRKDLKSKLFALAASCDRGFAAISADRNDIDAVVKQLIPFSTEKNPTRNIYPFNQNVADRAPLEAAWKMVYTSALDVLSLGANPLAQVQGVYQLVYRDGSAVNVINLAPRIQSIFPPNLVGDGSIVRLKVYTKAIARNETRIGLSFRKVELKPLTFFNRAIDFIPPLRATLPQAALFGADKDEAGLLYEKNSPGYFDILYLDEDTLIIKQAQPGGIFISVRSSEPIDSFL